MISYEWINSVDGQDPHSAVWHGANCVEIALGVMCEICYCTVCQPFSQQP